jgi:hypothetical protein
MESERKFLLFENSARTDVNVICRDYNTTYFRMVRSAVLWHSQ